MKKLFCLLYLAVIAATNLLPFGISRTYAAPVNLINNSSVETPDSSNSNSPQDWSPGGWGTNSRLLSYPQVGHSGSRSVKVEITSYSSGDAKWFFNPVVITPSAQYTFSDYFQSNIASSVVAQYADSNGNLSYQDLGSLPASSTWTQGSVNLTAPATAKTVTVFHLISGAGWLQTDDFSLTSFTPPTAPSVSMTAPANGATLTGSTQLSATASDDSGVAGVQFKVDGSNVGIEDTTAPYQVNWDTTTVTNGSHSLTAVARNTSNLTTTSAPVSVSVNNPVAPPVTPNMIDNPSVETPDPANSSSPQSWNTLQTGNNTANFNYLNTGHGGTRSLQVQITRRSKGDAKWYFNWVTVSPNTNYSFSDWYQSDTTNQIQVVVTRTNGRTVNVASSNQTASTAWKQTNLTFKTPSDAKSLTVYHYLNRVGNLITDDYELKGPTAPTVSITAPTNGATLSGIQTVTANASDSQGVSGVQFRLDGNDLGNPDTSAPYSFTWNTAGAANGSHTLTAVATNTAGLSTTSNPVTVDIQNTVTPPPPGGFIANGSVETVSPSDSQSPANWSKNNWGSNNAKFEYLNEGHSGNRSVKVTISNYSSGDGKWYFNPINTLQPGRMYRFSTWYKTNTIPHAVAMFVKGDGSEQYFGMPNPQPNGTSDWQFYSDTFTVPLDAVYVSAFLFMPNNGWVQTDDYSLDNYEPVGFNRSLISLTFDDGYEENVTNALPLLNQYGFKSTQCYETMDVEGNDSAINDIKTYFNSGHEICSHTVTHPFLTQVSPSQLTYELTHSQQVLQNIVGVPVRDFASPYGDYNQAVNVEIAKYYRAHRTVDEGFNSKDNFDIYRLRVQNMTPTTTLAQVQAWIDQAKATHTWLILVYHRIVTSAPEAYDTYKSEFTKQLQAISQSGITVKTMSAALDELVPQL